MTGKFFIQTLGCQMNKNDSERIAGLLLSLGFFATEKTAEADILIVNTCSVRQASEDKVFGIVSNWQAFRKEKPHLIIAVTGCMPGRDKDGKIKKRMKGVDLFFGIHELPMLARWVGERLCHCEELGGRRSNPTGCGKKLLGTTAPGDCFAPLETGGLAMTNSNYLQIMPRRENKSQAFVTIQTGCDNFCTYCVVPYSRGREKNRAVREILAEIKSVAEAGCKEITLLGQVVNHYIAPDRGSFSDNNPFVGRRASPLSPPPPAGDPSSIRRGDDFAALLWEVNQIEGIERIHWTAADPQYFSDEQVETLKLPKQVNYLHLPVQSGDNEILKKMNRHYTREQYIELIKKIRRAKPEIAIGTDIIVGFSGETEEQFNNTLDLYRQCDFDIAFQAMYSERSGTAAARAFKDDVPKVEKKRRWQALQDLMEETVYRKNQKYVEKVVEVLVERCERPTTPYTPPSKGGDRRICAGNSREMKLVQFIGSNDLIGKIVRVKIGETQTWVLRGVVVE